MKYYIVYKTTNIINNKEYIGIHVTNILHDSYLGSGIYLKKAIKKYGRENFKREILYIYDNEVDMMNMERNLVNEEYVNRKDTYNTELGGLYHSEETKRKIGSGNKGKIRTLEQKEKISEATKLAMTFEVKEKISKGKKLSNYTISEETRKKLSMANSGENNPFYGKTHNEETRKKMSENSFHSKMKGDNHPLSGKEKTEEHLKNLSEAMKNSEKHKEALNSEEYKLKMSEIVKSRPKKLCVHCDKMIDPGNYAKLHGDKCKLNPSLHGDIQI